MVELEVLFKIFLLAIIVDFLTGVLVAAKHGRLKSRTCSNGMFRSVGECIVLILFMLVDSLVPTMESICVTFMIGFIFKEALSIIENLVGLDVWIPASLKRALEIGVDDVDKKGSETNG